eukprot:jgi/Tetstr1/460274/TSEL_005574.t1
MQPRASPTLHMLPLLVMAALACSVDGHAFLSTPRARQVVLGSNELQSFNNPGSLCGKMGITTMDGRITPVQATYTAGQEIEIETTSTAFHKGYVVVRLCPNGSNPTETCNTPQLSVHVTKTSAAAMAFRC